MLFVLPQARLLLSLDDDVGTFSILQRLVPIFDGAMGILLNTDLGGLSRGKGGGRSGEEGGDSELHLDELYWKIVG